MSEENDHISPVRVLHVIGAMDRGGAESLIMNLYRKIDRNIIQFDFLVHEDRRCDFDEEILELGGRIYRTFRFNGLNYFSYCKSCADFFSNHNDYVAVHVHIGSCAAMVIRGAKRHGLYTIAHSHNTNPPLSILELGFRVFSFPTRYLADCFLACSEEAGRDRFGKRVVSSTAFSVLNNGIDVEQYRFCPEKRKEIRKQVALDDETLAICHIGRFSEEKNHIFLLKVFASLMERTEKKIVLCLIGRGPLEEKIKKEASDMGIQDDVRFFGVRSDVPNLLMGMDCFIFPSIWEGLGIAAIEAQASGLPSVLSPALPRIAFCSRTAIRATGLDDPFCWADLAMSAILNAGDREICADEVIKAGFDISRSAKKVTTLYLEHRLEEGK